MTEQTTREPIRLNIGERGYSSIHLLVSRLDEVKNLLTKNGVNYWVSDNYYSWNGGPEYAHIYLSIKSNLEQVRALLDSIAN